jgi:FkbM family methyltransferase
LVDIEGLKDRPVGSTGVQETSVSLFSIARRKFSPLHGVMTARDYHQTRRAPALQPGQTRVMGQPTDYSDGVGLLHSVREIFVDDVYRFKARTDRPHIIDAGANIGLSVRYFKGLYPDATIVAYEPDPAIFQILTRNVAAMPGVELRQAAAWTEETTLTFYTEGSLAGSTEIDFLGLQKPVAVQAESLKTELQKRPVDFLKIDIEGAENEVLFDIKDELDDVDHLFFEYHSTPDKAQRLGAMLDLVADKGFRYAINGPHGPRLPFVERVDHGFDLQLNVFCFRR